MSVFWRPDTWKCKTQSSGRKNLNLESMRANYFRKKWIYTEQNVLLVLRFRREAKLNAVKTLQDEDGR